MLIWLYTIKECKFYHVLDFKLTFFYRGQCEYELVLKTDLYTNRHTQWYYFRVQNAVPGVVYKFRIVNLLKKDSLYNYGWYSLILFQI